VPNISISIYLNEDDYLRYIQRKEGINARARELVKDELLVGKALKEV